MFGMNTYKKMESAIPYEETMGSMELPFFDPYQSLFPLSHFNNNSTYMSPCEVTPQQLHQPNYLNFLSEMPRKSAQVSQSEFPHFSSLTKLEMMTECNSRFKEWQASSGACILGNCHSRRTNNAEIIQPVHNGLQLSLPNSTVAENLNLDQKQFLEAGQFLPIRVMNQCYNHLVGKAVAHSPIHSGVTAATKQRIRWTKELHEQFVEAVNCLGGATKATPKGILKLMKSKVLTIPHIKSHLQKYRTALYSTCFLEGRGVKRSNPEGMPPSDLQRKGGLHAAEALHLQMDVQKNLHKQLEIQRDLQIRIEEHSKLLLQLFDQQKTFYLSRNHNSENTDGLSFLERPLGNSVEGLEAYLCKTDV